MEWCEFIGNSTKIDILCIHVGRTPCLAFYCSSLYVRPFLSLLFLIFSRTFQTTFFLQFLFRFTRIWNLVCFNHIQNLLMISVIWSYSSGHKFCEHCLKATSKTQWINIFCLGHLLVLNTGTCNINQVTMKRYRKNYRKSTILLTFFQAQRPTFWFKFFPTPGRRLFGYER